MEIGDRIREVRVSFSLNQTEFGKRVGLSQSAIGGYENNSHKVADQTIMHICKEYNINEEWLRTGEGEMFSSPDSDVFQTFADQYSMDEISRSAMLAFAKLPERDRRVVLSAIRSIANAIPEENETESDYERTARIVREKLDGVDPAETDIHA
ncbi:MAG: helix-turn-helix transcriptional regulator [Clostridia bacterium]